MSRFVQPDRTAAILANLLTVLMLVGACLLMTDSGWRAGAAAFLIYTALVSDDVRATFATGRRR